MATPATEAVVDDAERDPFEEEMLSELEVLAQKADVLTKWADEMYEYVKAIPQSESNPFQQLVIRPDLTLHLEPLPQPKNFTKREGETEQTAELRRNQDVEAEYNAVTCVALYLLLMSFSQKGIDRLRFHQEGMKMRDPEGRLYVSDGFDDGESLFWSLIDHGDISAGVRVVSQMGVLSSRC